MLQSLRSLVNPFSPNGNKIGKNNGSTFSEVILTLVTSSLCALICIRISPVCWWLSRYEQNIHQIAAVGLNPLELYSPHLHVGAPLTQESVADNYGFISLWPLAIIRGGDHKITKHILLPF